MSPRRVPESLRRQLDRRLADHQVEWRSTGLAGSAVRRGAPVWDSTAGTADADDPGAAPTADTQFRMGSITKTFTAVLVMQCRDDGLLDLDDPLDKHIPGTRHSTLTVRRMLAHLSGLQREPVGDVWEALEGPSLDDMIAGLEEAEAVLPPARRHHYSNLAFALLGEVVSRLRAQSWAEALQSRVLDPLEMRRTTTSRHAPFARGYFVDPYTERVREEALFPGNAFAPAAELWSTTDDLGRWASFIAEPPTHVLSPDTLEEMCHPQVMRDLDGWTLGWGLGFMLHRRGERVLVGHDGAMPGFLAGLAVRRPEKVGAVVLASTSAGADPGGLAIELALQVVDDDPDLPDPWRPGVDVPESLAGLLGVWWTEGNQLVFSARDGHLEAAPAGVARGKEPAVFAEEGPDRFRVVSGRETGEVLRVVRRADGSVEKLNWATYPVTRDPLPFGPLQPE
jgi:CubicO group peptidase (beta-lactamase class C family)